MESLTSGADTVPTEATTSSKAKSNDASTCIFDIPSGIPTDVLSVLDQLTKKLEVLQLRSEDYSRYQRLFGKTVYTYRALKETLKLRNQRHDLWQSLEDLSTKSEVWLNESQFRALNADDMGAEIQAFHRTASTLHRRMRSGATGLLVERVEEWRLRVSALLALGNPAMKARHWTTIFTQLLNEPYVEGVTQFTLSRLIELKAIGSATVTNSVLFINSAIVRRSQLAFKKIALLRCDVINIVS